MTAARLPPSDAPPVTTGWVSPARAGFEALVTKGPVMVAVATCFVGVAPARFQASPHVMLRFGHQLSPPIHDFSWNDSGIVGTLSFGDEIFTCRIPWVALVGIRADGPETPEPEVKVRGSHLKLVP